MPKTPILRRLRVLPLALVLLVGGSAAAQRPATYTVRAGDTLFRIATAHSTTVEELRRLNRLPDNSIRVGQTLRLPAGAVEPAQTSGDRCASNSQARGERWREDAHLSATHCRAA